MPLRMRLRLLLRSLAKLIAVIVVAGAAGVGLGIGISRLTGDDSPSSSADTSTIRSTVSSSTRTNETAEGRTATSTERTATASTGTQTQTTRRQRTARSVRVRVVSSVLHRGSTPSGRRSNRARLSVHVRVSNRGKRTIKSVEPVLVAGRRIRADRSAGKATRSLLRPVRPGFTADGTLRFETAGAVTTRLVSTRRARLHIAGRTATLMVRVGSPVRRASAGAD